MGTWTKSSYSYEKCLEVKVDGQGVQIRDDSQSGTVVVTSPDDWEAFINGVKAGEFDLNKLTS